MNFHVKVCETCRRSIPAGADGCRHCTKKRNCLCCNAQLKPAMLRCRECGAAVRETSQLPPVPGRATGYAAAAARVNGKTESESNGDMGGRASGPSSESLPKNEAADCQPFTSQPDQSVRRPPTVTDSDSKTKQPVSHPRFDESLPSVHVDTLRSASEQKDEAAETVRKKSRRRSKARRNSQAGAADEVRGGRSEVTANGSSNTEKATDCQPSMKRPDKGHLRSSPEPTRTADSNASQADSANAAPAHASDSQQTTNCDWNPTSPRRSRPEWLSWRVIATSVGSLAGMILTVAIVLHLTGSAVQTAGTDPSASPDRAAAEWVTDSFGVVGIRTADGQRERYVAKEHLPDEPFVVTEINLSGQEFDESDLAILNGLTSLERLDLSNTEVTDVALGYAGQAPALRRLYLRNTAVSAQGFRGWQNAEGIVSLSLSSNRQFDDSAIEELVQTLPNLTSLGITGTSVTDAGLKALGNLKELKTLYSPKGTVSEEGLQALAETLPECRIKA